jgi:hypothetical protein
MFFSFFLYFRFCDSTENNESLLSIFQCYFEYTSCFSMICSVDLSRSCEECEKSFSYSECIATASLQSISPEIIWSESELYECLLGYLVWIYRERLYECISHCSLSFFSLLCSDRGETIRAKCSCNIRTQGSCLMMASMIPSVVELLPSEFIRTLCEKLFEYLHIVLLSVMYESITYLWYIEESS